MCSTSSFYNTYMISHTSNLITHLVVIIMTMHLKLLSPEIRLRPEPTILVVSDEVPCSSWKNEWEISAKLTTKLTRKGYFCTIADRFWRFVSPSMSVEETLLNALTESIVPIPTFDRTSYKKRIATVITRPVNQHLVAALGILLCDIIAIF